MKAQSIGRKLNRGIATLEILIAFTIFILCISGVIIVNFSNQSIAIDSQINNEAISKTQSMLEKVRADSRFDFNSVNSYTTTETSNSFVFTKNLNVETSATDPTLDLWTKRVTSKITWQTAGRTLYTIFTTLLTNTDGVRGGDTCSSVLTGDWTQPQLSSYEFGRDLLVPPDTSSVFPIGDIDLNNHMLYVVVNNSNENTNPTLFKFDISNQSIKPVFVSSVDNNSSVKSGYNAISVADNYAYLANANGSNFNTCTSSLSCSQLQIIDIVSMTVVGKLKIPGVLGESDQAIGNSIFFKNGIVYLGLAKTSSGPEFNIIDVGGGGMGGSPSNPVYLGGLAIGNGINSIIVKDNYAYIASPNNQELKIIDVSSPSSPTQVGQFDAPDGGGNNGNGKSLAIVGNILYLGRTLLTGDEFYILNKTSPTSSLPVLNSLDVKNNSNSNTSINGITVRDYLVFLLTNNDFQIFKQDASYNMIPYATSLPTPGGKGTTMDCEENYIYFASVPTNDKGYITKVTGAP